MIANLSHSALDTWKSVAKFLVRQTTGKANKENELLLPYAATIFKNFEIDSRSSLIHYFEKLVGLGTLLKEQDLQIPKKITLKHLGDRVTELDTCFKYGFKEMIREVNDNLLSNYEGT